MSVPGLKGAKLELGRCFLWRARHEFCARMEQGRHDLKELEAVSDLLMRGKSPTCRTEYCLFVRGLRPPEQQKSLLAGRYTLGVMSPTELTISKDNPCLFITAVAKDRLPIFRTDAIKIVTCRAIDEARTSCGFLLFAYVLMPDHFHLITDSPKKPSEVLQYIKGIAGRRVIDYLKEQGYESSLRKLEHAEWKRNHRYSLWQHDSDVFAITSESMFMQKVNYTNLNPVRAGLVERAIDYRWSSARFWNRCPLEDEPLRIDIEKINWRRSKTAKS